MPKASKPDDKAARQSAGALLLLTKRGTNRARASASEAVDSAVAEVSRQGGKRSSKAALYGAVAIATYGLAGKLKGDLSAALAGSRRGAAVRARAELAKLGVGAPVGFLDYGLARTEEDALRAQAAADSSASAWRGAAMAAVSKAARANGSPTAAIERTRGLAATRAELAVKSEIARAFSDEHARSVNDAAKADPDFAAELKARRVVRVWSSVLEDRTCAPCADHHGDVAALGDDFGGDEPGEMHPRCQCTSYLTTEG